LDFAEKKKFLFASEIRGKVINVGPPSSMLFEVERVLLLGGKEKGVFASRTKMSLL